MNPCLQLLVFGNCDSPVVALQGETNYDCTTGATSRICYWRSSLCQVYCIIKIDEAYVALLRYMNTVIICYWRSILLDVHKLWLIWTSWQRRWLSIALWVGVEQKSETILGGTFSFRCLVHYESLSELSSRRKCRNRQYLT